MNKLIGITCNPAEVNGCRNAQLSHAYMDALRAAGGVPVALFDGQGDIAALVDRLDGLLLSGGADIDAGHFGQENQYSQDVDAVRDGFELALCRAFVLAKKPVLGICRGHQVIAVALGGTLVQDIQAQMGFAHPSPGEHEIVTRPDTAMRRLLGERHAVNSTHHQAVDTLPGGLMVSAISENGVIEAIEASDDRPIWGVQFHPERMYERDAAITGIFALVTGRA